MRVKFQLPALPWKEDALEPFMSAQTVRYHYWAHHKGYIEKTNQILEKMGSDEGPLERIIQNHDGVLYNNAAQAWNHTFFWFGLCETSKSLMPDDGGEFNQAIDASFGGIEGMQKAFIEVASGVFGSGYVWLTVNGKNQMEFISTQNAGNPLRYDRVRPLWTCDLWEHAYYLDYKNERPRFVDGVWDYINWDFVESNYLRQDIPNMTKYMVPGAKIEEEPGQHSAPVFD